MPLPTLLSGNVASATAGGYEIANSCRFNRPDSPYMHITPGSDGDLKIFTVSFWVKRGIANTGSSGTDRQVIFSNATNDQISFHNDNLCFLEDGTDSAITNMKFRDFSSWFHIVMAFDTSQSTNTNRQKVYVNGKQIDQSTGFSTMSYVAQDLEMGFGKGSEMMSVGRSEYDDNRHFDGYLAEFYYINGTMLDHTSFGEFDEDSPTIWKPKKFTGSFGTNGFYLDFEDSGDLGDDESGNGNDFTEVNLAAADQATDTPTNNFCTLNPLAAANNQPTFSEGNCQSVSSGAWYGTLGTMGVSAGKWYWEVKVTTTGGNFHGVIADYVNFDDATVYNEVGATSYTSDGSGEMYYGADTTTADYGSVAQNAITGIALNMDDKQISIYNNGSAIVSNFALDDATNLDFVLPFGFEWSATVQYNFGGCSAFALSSAAQDENGYGNFEYSPPSGYLALCTKNLGSDGG